MRDRRRSFSTSLNFCQTTLYSGIESDNEIHVRHKEIIISQRKSKRLKKSSGAGWPEDSHLWVKLPF